ncbi:MAG: DUF4194 domain-containing protein [Atopobiaceae bacterium]|nr:DUF4194 domain-containing protein [Atopobiaceae bacterium]
MSSDTSMSGAFESDGFPSSDEATWEQEAADDVALCEADQGTLPAEARRALTLLLRDAYVCALNSPNDYEAIRRHQDALTTQLNNLGLTLTISTRYEVAYAQQASLDRPGPLMLKKAQPLRRDATVLLVSIRARQHNDEANGEEDWFVSQEDLRELLESGPYAGELDGSRIEKALESAIKQLIEAGYLAPVPTAPGTLRVMPILPAVFTLQRAQELLAALVKDGGGTSGSGTLSAKGVSS